MYDNISEKIKRLAKASFILGIIGAFLLGVTLIASNEDIPFGIFILLGGPLISWFNSLITYGFGELIEKGCEIARNTHRDNGKSKTQSKVDYEKMTKMDKLRSQGLITEEEYRKAISNETQEV